MSQEIQTEIAVIGGGCAGLWLSHDLARRGYPCVLIESGGLAAFASQKNQSWLHSGALYAVIASEINREFIQPGLAQTARECLRGYSKLARFARRHCRRAISVRSECMFLFDDEEHAETARLFLKQVGLEPRVCDSSLHVIEPALTGTMARVGLITKDVPFESPSLLGAVVRRALHFGAQFVDCGVSLDNLRLEWRDTRWLISSPHMVVSASVVICTTGTLVVTQTEQFPFTTERPVVQKCAVAVFDRKISSRVLSFRGAEAQGLCIVPFRGGTTLNLGRTDDDSLVDVIDRSIPEGFYEALAEVLTFYAPGLSKWRWPIRSHAYICQKLGNINQDSSRPRGTYGNRHFYWTAGNEPRLYFGYAGKFTLSANFAQQFVGYLQNSGAIKKGSLPPMSSKPPKLADSPYHSDPTHLLQSDRSGNLRFVDRRV